MDEQAPPPMFLDVATLLESSRPQPRIAWFWIFVGAFVSLAILSSTVAQQSPHARQAVEVVSAFVIIGLMGLFTLLSVVSVRSMRAEQRAVDEVGELVQLRRWPQAAFMVQQILARPVRTQGQRAQALVYLAAVLSRYHRFEDAIVVHQQLLEEDLLDAQTALGIRLGRAMAMLREDHLFDADRAINELRRLDGARESAGLALVEIYRDVKTGHPDDALRMFEEKLPAIRDQLGHRVSDAYALAARAYDLQNRTAEAAGAWRRATLLAPIMELCRRYPELEKLLSRYPPAEAPAEMR